MRPYLKRDLRLISLFFRNTEKTLHHPACNPSTARLISYEISPIDANGSFLTIFKTADSSESFDVIFLSSKDSGLLWGVFWFGSETVKFVMVGLFFLLHQKLRYHQNHPELLQVMHKLLRHYQTRAIHKFQTH